MTLCELKTTLGKGFLKYIPVKHVSVNNILRILNETFETRPITLYNLRPIFMANDWSHNAT